MDSDTGKFIKFISRHLFTLWCCELEFSKSFGLHNRKPTGKPERSKWSWYGK